MKFDELAVKCSCLILNLSGVSGYLNRTIEVVIVLLLSIAVPISSVESETGRLTDVKRKKPRTDRFFIRATN